LDLDLNLATDQYI